MYVLQYTCTIEIYKFPWPLLKNTGSILAIIDLTLPSSFPTQFNTLYFRVFSAMAVRRYEHVRTETI